jgi:hypothetical protein
MRDATQALTIIAPIDPAKRATLEARLSQISDDIDGNGLFRPKDLPHTHFMRFVVLEGAGEVPALLAWESNHDTRRDEYLATVLQTSTIDRVLECCTGFPGTQDARLSWLVEHSCRAAAFYAAYRGVPREQVHNDRQVHDAIREALDGRRAADATDTRTARATFDGLTPREIQRNLCQYVRDTKPALDITPSDDQELRWLTGKVVAILGALALLPFILVVAPVWYVVLRGKEKTDVPEPTNRPVHDDKHLAELEDRVTQNQLTHIVDIKPGWFRYATLWFVLTAIDVVARVYSVRGDLGGITSIHFARWVILRDRWTKRGPKRHRLVFFSNYDGSWESYLGEFIDRASYGLTGVWSNTVGFPRTQSLLGAGARDEEAFKQWTRNHQIPTQVWWSGVPDSTVQNVLDDLWIRRHLDGGLADDEVGAWVRTL